MRLRRLSWGWWWRAVVGARRSFALRSLAAAVLVLAAAHTATAHATDLRSPVGLWKTIDDKTGKQRGLVRVYEQGGKFYGRIDKVLAPRPGHNTCEKCTDERKHQPIVGLLILRGLQREGETYSGGDILDPETGGVYQCNFHLAAGGRKLIVRGYIGFALIGRSQTWLREDPLPTTIHPNE